MTFIGFLCRNLMRRPLRTGLTCLGVGVAVGATVMFVGISQDFEDTWVGSMERRGVGLVVTPVGTIMQLGSQLDERLGEQLTQIPGVRTVAASVVDQVDIASPTAGDVRCILLGWPHDSFEFEDIQIKAGRRFRESEPRVALVGEALAANLGAKIGDQIEIVDVPFVIIGIFHSQSVFENGAVMLPIRESQQLLSREGSVSGYLVTLDSTDHATQERVQKQIEAIPMRAGLRLSALPGGEYVRGTDYIRLAHAMAWAISALALLIGGVTMLNAIAMSVAERFREIGMLRAVGWRPSRVLRMVLGESVLLSLCGAVAGIAGASLIARWLTNVPAVAAFVSGKISFPVVLEGIGLALLMGLIGGLLPALRATYLRPTEALRRE